MRLQQRKIDMSEALKAAIAEPQTTIKLDIGSGPNPKEGFVGIDSIAFGKNLVTNIGATTWYVDQELEVTQPVTMGHNNTRAFRFKDNCVSEANCSHVLEHLTNLNDKWERVHFWNELYRIMQHNAPLTLVIPHWNSNRYYGDPTHKEPWSEMSFYYLDRNWRAQNAPHADIANNPNGYSCDWEFNFGYSMHADLIPRNAEYQRFAMQFFKEACSDIIGTLKPRKAG